MAKITDLDKSEKKKKNSSSSSKKKSLKEAIEEDQNEDNDKVDTTHLYADNLNGVIYTETNAIQKRKYTGGMDKIYTATRWRLIRR